MKVITILCTLFLFSCMKQIEIEQPEQYKKIIGTWANSKNPSEKYIFKENNYLTEIKLMNTLKDQKISKFKISSEGYITESLGIYGKTNFVVGVSSITPSSIRIDDVLFTRE
jgi:hypothetical protein